MCTVIFKQKLLCKLLCNYAYAFIELKLTWSQQIAWTTWTKLIDTDFLDIICNDCCKISSPIECKACGFDFSCQFEKRRNDVNSCSWHFKALNLSKLIQD